MGRRGPLPQPSAVKKALGNPGKRQLNEHEPVPPAPPSGSVTAPAWMTKKGKAIWNELAPVVAGMGCLTTADRLPFARYCQSFARYLVLLESLRVEDPKGAVYPIKDGNGKTKSVGELPQAAELRRLHEILIKLEEHFGLTPASRSRIQVIGAAAPALPAAASSSSAPPANVSRLSAFIALGGPKPPPVSIVK